MVDFPSPQSPALSPQSRCGLSLTEVLIAMGILTLGLLGVASVFPVGSFYMQKADISDRGSAIAQSVFSDIMARGMLNPATWFVVVPPNASSTQGIAFPSDGAYAPVPQPVNVSSVRGAFARPFALSLGEALNQQTAATDPTLIGNQFGSAFVIDPLGVATMAFPGVPPQPSRHGPAMTFPATAYQNFFAYANKPSWIKSPWFAWSTGSANGVWPVRRVTFRQPNGWQMDKTIAEHYFRGNDDLAYDFPPRDDRPAMQNWDTSTTSGNTIPLSRKWTGDYSWIVTVVPSSNAARDGMARNPEGFAYDVSVVVFYKRGLPPDAPKAHVETANLNDYLNTMGENERAVKATIISTGLNGGELLLTDWDAGASRSAFEGLRTGEWIMLCGPHPNSNVTSADPPVLPTGESRFVLNWYQVITIDKEGTGIAGFDPIKQRVVTVRGVQWPWQPMANWYDYTQPSNILCAAICRGAVAVHAKSVRLESPGSSPVTFGGGGTTGTTPPKWRQPG